MFFFPAMETPQPPTTPTPVMQAARAQHAWKLLVLRGVARLLDGFFVGIPLIVLAGALFTAVGPMPPAGYVMFVAVLLLVLLMAYHPVCEVRFGGSFAKQLIGLRVVDAQGGRITPKQAFLRWLTTLAGWFGQIGELVAAVAIVTNEYHQRVGDVFAHTYVVESKDLMAHQGQDGRALTLGS